MTQPSVPIRGIIFDMDGVLCDSEPLIAEAASRVFAQNYGIKVSAEDFLPFVGTGEERFIGGVGEKYGIQLDIPRDKACLYEAYLGMIHGRLQPVPGAKTFTEACRAKGLRLAIATSADRIKMDGNLAQIGIPHQIFESIVTGERVRKKKPDPEVFLKAAKELGFSPEECLVIEDAQNGILAAKAAGSRCLGITTTYRAEILKAVGADWTAPDLTVLAMSLLDSNFLIS